MTDPTYTTVQDLPHAESLAGEDVVPLGQGEAALLNTTLAALRAYILAGIPTPQDGADGRTLLNGSGAPLSELGSDGDFYFDTTNWLIYGPKVEGAWPAGKAISADGVEAFADAAAAAQAGAEAAQTQAESAAAAAAATVAAEVAADADRAEAAAESIVGYIIQRVGDYLNFVNEDDQSIMARLNMATGLIETLNSKTLDSEVESLSFASGAQIVDAAGNAIRSTAGGNEYYEEYHGSGIRRAKRLDAHEARVRKAYIRSQFAGPNDAVPAKIGAQVNLVIWFGQSWAMGFDAVPSVNAASNYPQVLTFNGGVRQQKTVADDTTALQSFVMGVERDAVGTVEIPAGIIGETGAIAFANRVIELMRDENNIAPSDDYRLLVAAPGEGSKSIEVLCDPGSVYMARIQDIINQAYAICQTNGWTLSVPAVTWIQGQGDSDEAGIPGGQAAEYPQEMENARLLIQGFVDSVLPGHPPVKWITWQMLPASDTVTAQSSAKTVYERFVSGIEPFPHIVCSGPCYQFNNMGSSNIHFDAWSMAGIGRSMATAFKRVVIDGGDYEPLQPVSISRQGRIAIVETNLSHGKLVIDEVQVQTQAGCGFHLYDSGGSALTINTVSVHGGRIQIVAAANIPSGAELGYADKGTNYRRQNKWRGNIRDNHSEYLSGADNWLVAFRLPFDN